MKKYYASRSSLFLIELIISIFFFIVSAAIVLQLFVTSHFTSKDTININNSLFYSQNISEIFLGNNGSFSFVQNAYEEFDYKNFDFPAPDTMLLLFDKNWSPTTDISLAKYIILANYNTQPANMYGEYSCLNIYINTYSEAVHEFLQSQNYEALKTDSSYIHHLYVKKYVSL